MVENPSRVRLTKAAAAIPSLILIAMISVVGGCSRGGPKLYSATGQVTFNDEPLANAAVVFAPDDPQSSARLATGRTDATGTFKLETNLRPGATEGNYAVAVVATEENDSLTERPEAPVPPVKAKKIQRPKSLIPQQFANPKQSGLSYTVLPHGRNYFEIHLTGTVPQ